MQNEHLSDLEMFGFKTRKDGSLVYRDSEKNVMLYPTKSNRWGIALQLRRWVGGTQTMRMTASNAVAAALFAFDYLADPNNSVKTNDR